MRSLRTLILSLLAVLFAVSGVARAAPMPSMEPPCHQAPADHGKAHPAPAAMSCCVGCLPAPAETLVAPVRPAAESARYPLAPTTGEGRYTAPDPGPPRPQV